MDKRKESVTPIDNRAIGRRVDLAALSPAGRKCLREFGRELASAAAQDSGYTLIVRIPPSIGNL